MTILSTITHYALDLVANAGTGACADAAVPTKDCLAKAIEDSGTGFKIAQAVFRVVGIGVVIWTVKGVITALIGAKPVDAFKKLAGGVIAAVLCFNLRLPIDLIEGFSFIFKRVIEAINTVIRNNA